MAEPATAPLRGAIFDWGGVLTIPMADIVRAWLEADRVDPGSYAAAVRPWLERAYGAGQEDSPVHALERGEVAAEEFEELLAGLLVTVDGAPVPATGLLRRMFAASRVQADMLDLVRQLRAAGVRTGLLSNSWGVRDAYPRHLFGGLFDEVVISGEVGMRKPEERIFRLALARLGLSPGECVFIDDVEGNVAAARALGFAAIHHASPEATRIQLAELFSPWPEPAALAWCAMASARPYPHPSSEARSANMRGNRRTDTGPELALRRALHARGYRYRKDLRLDLPGGVRVRPDIVFTARRVAVFVDGCFWHCCPDHGSRPAANAWYWEPKLRRNVERDRAADAALGEAGWTVVRLWEHESLEAAVAAVIAAVGRPGGGAG